MLLKRVLLMNTYNILQIAIPKQSNVTCISWNHSSGYIAVGGEEGMLKVLKLESGTFKIIFGYFL